MGLRRESGDLPATSTHEMMLTAARALFHKHGFQNVSIEMICGEATVGRSTYYFYFKSKSACFAAVADAIMRNLYEVAGPENGWLDDYELLIRRTAAYLLLWLQEPKILTDYFALAGVDDQLREIVERNRQRFRGRFSTELQALIDRGEIQETNPHLLLRCLYAMIHQICLHIAANVEALSADEIADALRVVCEAWYRTIYGRPAPRGFSYLEHLRDLAAAQGLDHVLPASVQPARIAPRDGGPPHD